MPIFHTYIPNKLDSKILDWFWSLRVSAFATGLTPFFLFLTLLGEPYVVIAITIIFSVYLWFKKQIWKVSILWLSVVGSSATTYVLKKLIDRPRPEGIALVLETSYSFPSGHATAAMALYGFITLYFVLKLKKLWARWLIGVAGMVLVLLIGSSRLYLGVHYFTDVFVGYVIGISWIFLGYYLLRKFKKD